MRVVMTALRHVAVLAKGRCDADSFSTIRSSSGTYLGHMQGRTQQMEEVRAGLQQPVVRYTSILYPRVCYTPT